MKVYGSGGGHPSGGWKPVDRDTVRRKKDGNAGGSRGFFSRVMSAAICGVVFSSFAVMSFVMFLGALVLFLLFSAPSADESALSRISPDIREIIGMDAGKEEENEEDSEDEDAPVGGNVEDGLQTGTVSDDGTEASAAVTGSISDAVGTVMPSVVQVTVRSVTDYEDWFGEKFEIEAAGMGSGVLMMEDDGYIYIATNNHVVADEKGLAVTFCDGKSVSGKVVSTDEGKDLAVIKVGKPDIPDDTVSAIRMAKTGNPSSYPVGSSVAVIGNAMGFGQSVTAGIISGFNRTIVVENGSGKTVTMNGLIQTDAAVNAGNSGGAMIDGEGKVIGIVSAKYADTGVEGMGYAIPVKKALRMVKAAAQ